MTQTDEAPHKTPTTRTDPFGNPLVKRMYYKGRKYYMVYKNVWYPLGRHYKQALQRATAKNKRFHVAGEYDEYIRALYTRSRQNAKGSGKNYRRSIAFEIDGPEFFLGMIIEQGFRCAVTGAKFDLTVDEKSGRRPMAPSIDRIDSSLGYTEDNVRLVCQITNLALNNWGEDYLLKIAVAYFHHQRNKDEMKAMEAFVESYC